MATESWNAPASGQLITSAGIGLLVALLVVAVWHDVRSRRIPNAVVFSGAALALALHAVLPAGLGFASPLPGGIGFLKSLAGLAVGLAGLLPLYLLRAMGAGDVKLMAMVGAFLGPVDTLGALVGTFVAGAVLAVAVEVKAGVLSRTVRNIRLIVYAACARLSAASGPVFDPSTDTAAKVPYAVAVALGTCGFLALKRFAFLS
jgi:prepilin peptidase CpaA